MAYRFYHGRTGIVWNVTPSSVGVIINKQLGNRIRRKKFTLESSTFAKAP